MTYCIKCRIINIFHFFIFCLHRSHRRCLPSLLLLLLLLFSSSYISASFGFPSFSVEYFAFSLIVCVRACDCVFSYLFVCVCVKGAQIVMVWLLFIPSLHFVKTRSNFKMVHTASFLTLSIFLYYSEMLFHILHSYTY